MTLPAKTIVIGTGRHEGNTTMHSCLHPQSNAHPDFSPSLACQTLTAGSSSFAAAARMFDPTMRESTAMLYAWCRHCDDAIDGQQLGHGQACGHRADNRMRLADLEDATRRTCAGWTGADPVFAGLAEVVRRHGLPQELLFEHLAGFGMDVNDTRYATLPDTLLYCYRVAGTVGLMMARVMGVREPAVLDRACDLGLAFQLSNIARDVVEDAAIGRVYLPSEWLAEAGVPTADVAQPQHREPLAAVVARLVEVADAYYVSAVSGIGALPWRCAWAVATARDVYRALGHKVKRRGARAWDARMATSSLEKVWFTARGAALALAAKTRVSDLRAADLWQRPVRSGY